LDHCGPLKPLARSADWLGNEMDISPDPQAHHIEAALEASCETLVALELMRAAARDGDPISNQARHAIKSLRRAITELRSSSEEPVSALAYGFVLGDVELASGR
jgi:hypothetical protein